MTTIISTILLAVALNGSAPPPVVSDAELDAALSAHTGRRAAQEQQLQSLFDRPEVRELAGRAHLDLARAQAAVATLDDAELAQLAARSQHLQDNLAGGDNIVITPYALIIALLVVIILLVA
jgi:hypothetical protein